MSIKYGNKLIKTSCIFYTFISNRPRLPHFCIKLISKFDHILRINWQTYLVWYIKMNNSFYGVCALFYSTCMTSIDMTAINC